MLAVQSGFSMSQSSPWAVPSLASFIDLAPGSQQQQSQHQLQQQARQRPMPDVFQNQHPYSIAEQNASRRTKGHSIDRDDLLGPQMSRDGTSASPKSDSFPSDKSSTRSSPPSASSEPQFQSSLAYISSMPGPIADSRYGFPASRSAASPNLHQMDLNLPRDSFASTIDNASSPHHANSYPYLETSRAQQGGQSYASQFNDNSSTFASSAANTAGGLDSAIMATNALASLGVGVNLSDKMNAAKSTQIQSGGSVSGDEEITTIFVVGFPEDMHEREFQNMFIFCPGFEAATLKTPYAGSSSASNSSRDGPMPNYNLDLYGRPYANSTGVPAFEAHTAEDRDGQPRKQAIGFAKFRTRQEAIDARDVLSGRRVDADRDCVLKAEMAKKNLHTRRGLANEAPVGAQSSVGVGNTAGNASLPPSLVARGQASLAAAAALDPALLAGALALQANAQGSSVQALLRDGNQQLRDARSATTQSAAFSSTPPSLQDRRNQTGSAVVSSDPRYTSHASVSDTWANQPHTAASTAAGPSYHSAQQHAAIAQLNIGSSLMQQIDSPSAYNSPSSAVGQTSDGYTRHAFYNANGPRLQERAYANPPTTSSYSQQPSSLSSRLGNLTLNTALAATARPQSPSSPGLTSPRGPNPADMNPPINTLYVGGLPAVLPSLTGPMSASHLEDSLRAVFSRSAGFKRLNFRQKSNGPMSFVEYENVDYATRALHDLYGHTLGGLVKGGIRLSYSKNPLGVRSNSVSTNGLSGPLSPTATNGYLSNAQSAADAFNNATLPSSRRFSDMPSFGGLPRQGVTSPAPSSFSPFSSTINSNGY